MSFFFRERAGVRFLVSDLLPCPHAFGTRIGGVSVKEHLSSLNVGENRGDDPANPLINIARLLDAAGLPPAFVSARQIHSAVLAYVQKPRSGDDKPELDGFYTDRRGISLMVKVADCLPILMCDRKTGAVAAVHAGWRGSAAGIAVKGVEALRSLGADARDIVCAIGPGIGPCCFEVREDFISAFLEAAGSGARRYIEERDGRTYADLKSFNRDLLLNAGLSADRIDVCPLCTCCDPVNFFSHRYSGGVRGTLGAAVAMSDAPHDA